MKKWIFLNLIVFLVFGILSLTFAPDTFSLVIICVMCFVLAAAFLKGIWTVFSYADGFRTASAYVGEVKDVTSSSKWNTFRQSETIFRNHTLDMLWNEYQEKVEEEEKEELVCSDIESVINEDVLALYSWKPVILQIPGTLTALGLIGTFLGLILGISGIAFSSVDAAISSITMLLAGIETAFYTSIIGVILSILFNLSYKFAWNSLMREMGVFMNGFHRNIYPEEECRRKQNEHEELERIIERLDRIPKGMEYYGPAAFNGTAGNASGSERTLMSEIWEGIKNDDFLFYIQPRVDLNTRKIIGGEALMRWNHSRLGIVSPAIFFPMLEKNGYIVKMDCGLWEAVCRELRRWLDEGIRPVPISVNISKMDLLVMNVPQFFADLISKYQIPPQYIQVEIAENAYTQCQEITREAEMRFRQDGFQVIINGTNGEYDTLCSLVDSEADALKIEYSMLTEQKRDNDSAVTELVEIGRKARIRLIASGIENVKQFTMLRKAGFTEGQGFFLYKPVDVKSFEGLLED